MTETTETAAPIGHNKPPRKGRKQFRHVACEECGQAFVGERAAVFCSTDCKTDHHNRNTVRGRAGAMELALAWREGRGSTPEAKFAYSQLCALLDGWLAEDRAAGRTSNAKAMRRRMQAGWTAADQLAREESRRRVAKRAAA